MPNSARKRVAVIGAGFSSLACATLLAHHGYEVSIFEKNAEPGGRARKFSSEGYTFDMGPSWYWMPDVFEKYFNLFGKQVSDYYQLVRLDPSYRVFYSPEEIWDIPADLTELGNLFEKHEPGSSKHLFQFLKEGEYKYEIGINELVFKPGLSFTELLDMRLIKGALRLHVFQSMATYLRKYFRNPKLLQLLEFPVLFLGASPADTPALYSLMNYADIALGTWYPMGGINKISEGMARLASSSGVTIHYQSEVSSLQIADGKVEGLTVNGVNRQFDFVVGGADYQHVEQKLLPREYRRYDEKYWDSRLMSPSSLIFYIGVNKKVKNLLHHNLFFDEDFKKHADEIYSNPQWPTKPLFYVCCPSKTDNTVAPEGCENIFILIPVASGLTDETALREKYFELVINRMEKLTGENFAGNITFKKSYAHNDFTNDYHSFKGNAYGLANTLLQTANFKPSIINKKVRNLFYTGQLTVPGPGIPPSIISGQVVARELIRQNNT